MRGTWSTTRCPAPTRATGGVLRCVSARSRCTEPTHQDQGAAHTCPLVRPCRACAAPRTRCDHDGCPWWVETGSPTGNALQHRVHLREAHHR